jgi:hypothetical protein
MSRVVPGIEPDAMILFHQKIALKAMVESRIAYLHDTVRLFNCMRAEAMPTRHFGGL